ncbi:MULTISPECIES: hypothetical protein [Marinobacter]|uniref:hypothetical protein n=1 Tax=Marinobacter TaxID=2742 RepID=UPI001B231038|nr:hypothetical protein [Marinobacter sp.]MBO6810351.1 hypothetical protein [Marinobacter sp.]MBO6873478.1 hypothetical protein [Marinobacter sp.]
MKQIKAFIKYALMSATLIGQSMTALASEHPAVVESLIDRGVTISGTFDAPGGMTGYVGSMEGWPVAFYLTTDRQHVVVGPMLDSNGVNLTESKLRELVFEPDNDPRLY